MPFEERASTAPLTRRAARRAPESDKAAAPAALTRRQRRDVPTATSPAPTTGWQPRQAEVVPPTTVQVEVVGPVVPEPSAPTIIEPVRPAAEPRSLEPRPVEPRPVEPRSVEPRAFEPRSVEPRSVEPRAFEPRSVEPRSVEPRAVEPRPHEPRPVEPRLSAPIDPSRAERAARAARPPIAPVPMSMPEPEPEPERAPEPEPPVARRSLRKPAPPASEPAASDPVTPATRAVPTFPEAVAPATRVVPTVPTSAPIAPVRSAYTPIVPDPVVAPPTPSAPIAQERIAPEPIVPPAEPTRPRSAAPRPITHHVDEFERAARLFSFTGENPTISTSTSTPVPPVAPTSTAAPAAPEVPNTRRARRITAASLSLVGIAAVGLLTVGMTLPSQAVAAATGAGTETTVRLAGDVADGGDGDIQAFVASAAAGGSGSQGSLQHSSGFSTGTQVQLAGTDGISNVSNSIFNNNANCPVQWPFAIGVPISYGFGPRPGEFHEGADFTPGDGAHIQAIADGVVVVAQDNYQGYGTAVIIDHVINGQRVASLYGHMQYDSMQVHVGQKVKVGEYIGRTGNTGHSFGAHTHVEIRQNDVTPIDPVPWLRSHNVC